MRIADVTETGIAVELEAHDLALLAYACSAASDPMDTEPYHYSEFERAAALFETAELVVRMRAAASDDTCRRFTFANLRAGLVELREWRKHQAQQAAS